MKNVFIAYFSREGDNYINGKIVDLVVGNTEFAANVIREMTGGELFKIESVRDYSADYRLCVEEAKEELKENARPVLKACPDSIEADTIILGYPNWCGTMPMPVWTFLETFGFAGKTIMPFCTNEGSGMGHSEEDIRKLCPEARLARGLAIKGSNVKNAGKDIEKWLQDAEIL